MRKFSCYTFGGRNPKMTDSSVAKLVMTADPMAKADAERLAVKIGGIVSVVSAEERIPERRKTRPICILYLEGHEPLTRVKGSLEQVAATDQDVVLYVASHPDPKMIFAWGMLCQSLLPGKSRGIVSSSEELRAVLEESTDEQSPPTVEGLRKTFSLTQKQLARVADVTERTIQNWERAQMPLSGSRSLTNLAELREI